MSGRRSGADRIPALHSLRVSAARLTADRRRDSR